MDRMSLRKTLSAATLLGGMIVAANVLAQMQGGNGQSYGMMHGNGANWMGGYGGAMDGYGGWVLVLLVIVVAGLVVWIVKQKKK